MPKAPPDRKFLLLVLKFVCVSCLLPIVSGQTRPTVAAPETQGANLPAQAIGANDLIAVSVYDAPELTRTVRVSTDGFVRLPMLKQRVKAQGLMPGELESAIDRKSTRLNSSHLGISYAVFCLKKKKNTRKTTHICHYGVALPFSVHGAGPRAARQAADETCLGGCDASYCLAVFFFFF